MASPFVAGIIAIMLSYHRNGGDHDTPLTNWKDAIDHLNKFSQPGALVTQSGDPLPIGLLNFNKIIAKSISDSCETEAFMSGVSPWRISLYQWLHSIMRKIIL